MALITLHTGMKMDSAELSCAEFHHAGSSKQGGPYREPRPLYAEDELLLVFLDKRITEPIRGADARKVLAELARVGVTVHHHPAVK